MSHTKPRFPPRLAISCCAILWSTSGLFVKIIAWNPFVIAGARSFFAALFMLLLQRCMRQSAAQPAAPQPSFMPPLVWLTGITYSLTMILFVVANKLTASANVIVLQYGAPVWAALFGALFIKEKPKWENGVSLFLIFAGLYIMLKDGFVSGGLLGNTLAAASGVVFGMATVFLRMQKNGRPQDGMILSHIITVCICLPFMFIYTPALSIAPFFSIVYMGVFQVGLAAVLYAYGIKKVGAVPAMLISAIEPIFNPLWVFFAIGETPAPAAYTGGGIILAAVLFSNIIGWRRDRASRWGNAD